MVVVKKIPEAVQAALSKLDAADRAVVESLVADLQAQIPSNADYDDEDDDDEELPDASNENDNIAEEDEDPTDYPPIYDSAEANDDMDKAIEAKQAASNCKDVADWDGALEHYTTAIQAAPPSSLLYANRAQALFQLGRFRAAERDCNLALHENPDSAKALRMRGKIRKELGDYENALADLSLSQTIDFDEGTVEDLKFLSEKRIEKEKVEAEERIQKNEKLRKRAEEIKRAKEEAQAEAAKKASAAQGSGAGSFGGMPGGMGGMPGGMGGIPGMEGLMGDVMKDPELMAALQNPKVQTALAQMMGGGGDPAKIAELMSDPEVGPVLQKFMSKFQGGGGGGASAFGGGGGSMGGRGGGGENMDEGDIPDLDDLPDLE